jgi:calcineurin-like phosphoesterase family protein
MNISKWILVFALGALVPSCWAEDKLRFAQLTDLHIFDAGYNCYEPDANIEHTTALDALRWSIDQINQENRSSPLDFVVITGDFGLANLISSGGTAPPAPKPNGTGCNKYTAASDRYGPVKPEQIETAAVALACLLRALDVKAIYIVPGNNDVKEDTELGIESPLSRTTWRHFVDALGRELPGRIRDLSGASEIPSDAPVDVVRGFWLVGLDSASFKPSEVEREQTGPKKNRGGPCQGPDSASPIAKARADKLADLAASTDKATRQFLLFTHIPDLQDPYRKAKKDLDQNVVCTYGSSWFLSQDAQISWNRVLSNKNLTGIFAGHFHAPEMNLYGGPFSPASAASGTALRNVFIAPPLSMKNQWSEHYPRRGWMIVKLTDGGVQADVRWYTGIDPTQSASPAASKISPASRLTVGNFGKLLTACGIITMMILGWDIAMALVRS